LFHEIVGDDSELSSKYKHNIKGFEEQLDYLVQNGYTTILPSEINCLRNNLSGRKNIILSFDDGTADHFSIVYPLLKERNLRGVFFVISGNMNKRYGLSRDKLAEMSNNGMEIGSHSHSHRFLDELGREEVFYELKTSKKILSDAIGKEVTSFAPPGGWYSDMVITTAKEVGYRAFFTCNIGTNDISELIYVYNSVEVLGTMSLDQFKRCLDPSSLLSDKLVQSTKAFVHKLIGSDNYKKIGNIIHNNPVKAYL